MLLAFILAAVGVVFVSAGVLVAVAAGPRNAWLGTAIAVVGVGLIVWGIVL